MVVFHCVGCRAVYAEARAPRRCARCHGKAFAAVDDNAPTSPLLDAGPVLGTPPENLDAELAAAFAESERFRLAAVSGRPYVAPAPVVLEGDDAPATPRDMPYDPALSVNRPERGES
jgi:rubredoxin